MKRRAFAVMAWLNVFPPSWISAMLAPFAAPRRTPTKIVLPDRTTTIDCERVPD